MNEIELLQQIHKDLKVIELATICNFIMCLYYCLALIDFKNKKQN